MAGSDSIAPVRNPWICRLVVLLTASMAHAGPSVRFVEDDAIPGGNGLTWNTAYRHLQDALFEAAADLTIAEVRVAGGTYKPDVDEGGHVTALDRLATFTMRNNLALRGGYRGLAGEGEANDQDFVEFETILTGDLAVNDGPDFADNDENSYSVVTSRGTDATAVLDGFTITGGYANHAFLPFPEGGGLFNDSGSPSIMHCIFRQNRAQDGGGFFTRNGSPTLSHCEFSANQTLEITSFQNRGAGMFVEAGTVHVVDCTFSQNQSASPFSAGGGIACGSGANVQLERCTFTGNRSAHGGGIFSFQAINISLTRCDFFNNTAPDTGGGGMIEANAIRLLGCRFRSCTSRQGGGLWIGGNPGMPYSLIGCEFDNNSASSEFNPGLAMGGGVIVTGHQPGVVAGCRFTNNSATGKGGGLFAMNGAFLIITNSIFNANSSALQGGGMALDLGTAVVANCTFTDNFAPDGNAVGIDTARDGVAVANCILRDGGNEIFVHSGLSQFALTFSNVQGGWPGVGNIDADPLFADPLGLDDLPGTADDDFHLRAGSPCIDAADNSQVPPDLADLDDDGDVVEPTPFDWDGGLRRVDDPVAPDTGLGDPPLVDMGALEYQADCNTNGVIDSLDIASGSSNDSNTNGIPDECETAIFNLDIKPGWCPNSFNPISHGVLSVALLSTPFVDVADINLTTLTISRADGVGESVGPSEGPPGPHTVFADVATPFDGEGCDCHEVGGDGSIDLSMKFRTDDVVAALQLDFEPPGALIELVVSGRLNSGRLFKASDCVQLVPPGTAPGPARVISEAANR